MADEQFENTDAVDSNTDEVYSQRLNNGSLVIIKANP